MTFRTLVPLIALIGCAASWEGKKGPRSGRAAGVYEIENGRIRRAWYFPAVP